MEISSTWRRPSTFHCLLSAFTSYTHEHDSWAWLCSQNQELQCSLLTSFSAGHSTLLGPALEVFFCLWAALMPGAFQMTREAIRLGSKHWTQFRFLATVCFHLPSVSYLQVHQDPNLFHLLNLIKGASQFRLTCAALDRVYTCPACKLQTPLTASCCGFLP